jgi:hypothetical protein
MEQPAHSLVLPAWQASPLAIYREGVNRFYWMKDGAGQWRRIVVPERWRPGSPLPSPPQNPKQNFIKEGDRRSADT